MKLPQKTLEKKLFKSGYRLIYAVDEVGMGCLAGPVVVCAVGITNTFYISQRLTRLRRDKLHKNLSGLRESKLLSAAQREHFAAELLKEKDLVYALALASPKTTDRLNIYQASRLAMKRAVLRLANPKSEIRNPKQSPKISNLKSENVLNFKNLDLDIVSNLVLRASDLKSIVLVDGKTKIKSLDMEQMAIVKGDRKVFAIACASIIAKVYRDRMMTKYAKKYPGYGFEKHKGYGTKYHQAKLTSLGPCEIHRKSFAPVTKLI